MVNRDEAVRTALAKFDEGPLLRWLTKAVAIRSTSQDAAMLPEIDQYLEQFMVSWLRELGFVCQAHANPLEGF